ncbi:MAG: sigma-54-dependent Fis family transcriptional regulator, partial [Planctomycetes bacterium]|nr:sigma-54-dependent Fis family transcriptional regulator [Planctomycetota bacterium]
MKLLARIAEATPGREVFSEILDALARRIDCERAFLFSLRPRGGFSVLAARTRDEEDISRPGERMSHHAVRKMVATRDTVFVEDARRDRRYRAEEALEGKPTARSILVIPLAARGEVRGGIYADHRFAALEPPAEDDEAVCGLAALAALALEIRERPRRGREASRPAQEGAWAAAGAGGEPAGTGATDERTAAGSRDEPPVAGEARLARVLEGRGGRPELFQGLLSTNPDMQDLFETVRSLARSDLPVLIQGETGTGKSLLARAVHAASTRSARPFVTFHCGTAPESLVEGELLGHVRGAFTGAEADHEGVLVTADGGTLFLDEVGDMSPAAQAKVLRALEEGVVTPIG